LNQDDQQTYAIKAISKKKLNRMNYNSKKRGFGFLESEMAILKKLVILSIDSHTLIGSSKCVEALRNH